MICTQNTKPCGCGYDIQYNNTVGKDMGVILYDYPTITSSKKSFTSYAIPGRQGELVSDDESSSNITITCNFTILAEDVNVVIRNLRRWLTGTGELILSDSPYCYYEVLAVQLGDLERILNHYAKISAVFTCTPYEFEREGKKPRSNIDYNAYDLCKPTYQIAGEGVCTLTVNGKTMTANIGQNLTIDSRKMLAYRADGTLMNTSVTGRYEDLWIPHGDCEISITSGFTLQIIPNWGYEA